MHVRFALVIDRMDICITKMSITFCLDHSDCDFTPLR